MGLEWALTAGSRYYGSTVGTVPLAEISKRGREGERERERKRTEINGFA